MPRVPGPLSTAATKATVASGPKLGHGPKAAKRPPPGALSPTIANCVKPLAFAISTASEEALEPRCATKAILSPSSIAARSEKRTSIAPPGPISPAPTRRRKSRAPATKIPPSPAPPPLEDCGEGDPPFIVDCGKPEAVKATTARGWIAPRHQLAQHAATIKIKHLQCFPTPPDRPDKGNFIPVVKHWRVEFDEGAVLHAGRVSSAQRDSFEAAVGCEKNPPGGARPR